jgi:hypothetical protein
MKSIAMPGRAALAAGVLIACAACTTQFDAQSGARIQSVAFKPIEEPDLIAADQFVLRAYSVQPGEKSFSELMAAQNLHLGAELKAAVSRQLEIDGYKVSEDSAAADAMIDLEIKGFPPVNVPAYAAAATNYEPEFVVWAELDDAKTKRALFRRIYVYRDNSIKPMDGSLLIRPDAKYSFATQKGLFDNPALAAEGLRAGLDTIAKSIGESLKKQ